MHENNEPIETMQFCSSYITYKFIFLVNKKKIQILQLHAKKSWFNEYKTNFSNEKPLDLKKYKYTILVY